MDPSVDRMLIAATALVARDLWGAHHARVSYVSWDRGHLDDETYNLWLKQAAALVMDEATDDKYGGTPQALALLPKLLWGLDDAHLGRARPARVADRQDTTG